MSYRWVLKPYRHPFEPPLQTHHGLWTVREGIFVGLQNEADRIEWGEIAPIPWFGTETLEAAIAFCQTLPQPLTESEILAIPDDFPACQFGFGSAWENLQQAASPAVVEYPPAALSALLPVGEAACQAWSTLWHQGHRTFKWKIGVFPLETELQIFARLMTELPPGTKLRLDANGGLTYSSAQQWLEHCDRFNLKGSAKIEYLEQPLPPDPLEPMCQLSHDYQTPIALDESVATLPQLRQCYEQGWRGVVVIKPVIAGYPQALRSFLQNHSVDAVFSSAFETTVGRAVVLAIAQQFSYPGRAFGFSHPFVSAHSFRVCDKRLD